MPPDAAHGLAHGIVADQAEAAQAAERDAEDGAATAFDEFGDALHTEEDWEAGKPQPGDAGGWFGGGDAPPEPPLDAEHARYDHPYFGDYGEGGGGGGHGGGHGGHGGDWYRRHGGHWRGEDWWQARRCAPACRHRRRLP